MKAGDVFDHVVTLDMVPNEKPDDGYMGNIFCALGEMPYAVVGDSQCDMDLAKSTDPCGVAVSVGNRLKGVDRHFDSIVQLYEAVR